MSLSRDIPQTVIVLEDSILATCSDLMSTTATTAAVGIRGTKTTASALISSGDIGDVDFDVQGDRVSTGGMVTSTEARILDRTRIPGNPGLHYQNAVVFATLQSSRGTSNADAKCALGVSLFHGDSSGGGDLAEYTTGARPNDRVFFSSARTSDMSAWDVGESSGVLYLQSYPGIYDLRGAGKYLQVRPRFGINAVTTESTSLEQSRAGAGITFFAGDLEPPNEDTTSPFSTSTST